MDTNYSRPRYTIAYALRKGYYNLVRYLLNQGSDPNQLDDNDKSRRTPLIYCTYIKEIDWSLSIAQNLLEYGASLKKSDSKKLNPLHYCCTFGKEKLLELFLNSLDFDILNAVDLYGNTCLHYAVKYRNLDCIRVLLQKFRHYNIKTIEYENYFGILPTQLYSLHERFERHLVSGKCKDIDEKCLNMIRNYTKTLSLYYPQNDFVNVVKRATVLCKNDETKENKNSISSIATSTKSILNRPKTAPLKPKENSINLQSKTSLTNEPKIELPPPTPQQQHKQKITFDVNENKCATISTVKKQLKRPNSAIAVLKSSSTGELASTSNEKFTKNRELSQLPENLFLLDKHDLLNNAIKYKDLCYAKEYLIDQVVDYTSDYGVHKVDISDRQKSFNYLTNIITAPSRAHTAKGSSRCTNTKMSQRASTALQRQTNNETPLLGRKTSTGSFIAPGDSSPTNVLRCQSFILDSNSIDYYDMIDPATNVALHDTQEVIQINSNIEMKEENLNGWKQYMKKLLNELEIKHTASMRKTIHPPVSTVIPGSDVNSSHSVTDRSKLTVRVSLNNKSLRKSSRQNSVLSLNSNQSATNSYRKSKVH